MAVLSARKPTVNSEIGKRITILSGDIGTVEDNSDNTYHVVTGSGTAKPAILDEITITSGNANGASEDNLGGGMYNDAGSLVLTNVTFSGNHAGNGGGMFNRGSGLTFGKRYLLW